MEMISVLDTAKGLRVDLDLSAELEPGQKNIDAMIYMRHFIDALNSVLGFLRIAQDGEISERVNFCVLSMGVSWDLILPSLTQTTLNFQVTDVTETETQFVAFVSEWTNDIRIGKIEVILKHAPDRHSAGTSIPLSARRTLYTMKDQHSARGT